MARRTTPSFADDPLLGRARHGATAAFGAALMVLAAGCGSSVTTTPAELPDQPVPPNEPRADVRFEVDLHPAQDCEERFDLALYENRGIELIAWDDAKDSCEKRAISVRYLSRKLGPREVEGLVEEHAAAARAAPATVPTATSGNAPRATKPNPETPEPPQPE